MSWKNKSKGKPKPFDQPLSPYNYYPPTPGSQPVHQVNPLSLKGNALEGARESPKWLRLPVADCSPSEIWRRDTLPENWLKIIVTKWLHELKPFAYLSVSCFLTNRWMNSRGMSRIACANSVIFAIEKGGLWQLSLAVLSFQLQTYPYLFILQNV